MAFTDAAALQYRGVLNWRWGIREPQYPLKTAGLEAFARVLWGLAPYFCGGGTSEETDKELNAR